MAIIVDEKTNGFPIGTVIIDGYRFDKIGYGMLQTANTLSYVESPKRSNTGAIYIQNYDTYVVPSCQIGFGLIDIEQYMLLRRLLMARKEHTVNYFDADFGKRVEHRMMVDDDKLKAFFSLGSKVIGMQNYSIKFEATLSPWETYKITYHGNGGILTANATAKEVCSPECSIGETIKIEEDSKLFTNGDRALICYADKVDADGAPESKAMRYYPGEEIVVCNNIDLYAVWG